MVHYRLLLQYFHLLSTFNTVKNKLSGFEPRISGAGSDCSTNCATTTAHFCIQFSPERTPTVYSLRFLQTIGTSQLARSKTKRDWMRKRKLGPGSENWSYEATTWYIKKDFRLQPLVNAFASQIGVLFQRILTSVTSVGNFLHFGQLFKAFCNN